MSTQNKANIMVFGIDRLGYRVPSKPLDLKNSLLHFKQFQTEEKFQDYDSVIMFQGTFEEVRGDTISSYAEKDLNRRENQLRQLISDKSGFCCFLLVTQFIDKYGARDTDLAKRVLNYPDFYRNSSDNRITNLRVVRDEFRAFLKEFGVAQTSFQNFNPRLNVKPICFVGRELTGFLLNNCIFFIPCLLPEKNEKEFNEYFSLLGDALVSLFNKLSQELPQWTAEYIFKQEAKLLQEREQLIKRIDEINRGLRNFKEYKKCLCYDDELLKESVVSILLDVLKFPIDTIDKFKEDIKILDEEQKPMILVEVKGTNKGVQREFINQADSHRERSGFSADFPSIVIINTNIKSAKSLKDKYQEVAKEQVAHAVKMKILVLRTIDFLNLLYLVEANKITCEEVLELFKNQHGWLKVTQEDYQIEKGTE